MSDPGAETQISGALTNVPPVPRYEDEEAELLGETLAELYARRERDPGVELFKKIEEARRELRRGPRLRPGEFLKDGRYRLVERMGDSAGDATWKAWDRDKQMLVVVKEMVGPWVAQKMRVGAFLESAGRLQSLDHAGLARVLEAAQNRDGFVYLVTEYYDGGTLATGWTGDATDVLQVLVELGNALQAAHDSELVHARVFPKNVHFGLDGGAHLADFDLAGENAQDERGSQYVAPEAVERGQRATAASDVYSLAMCGLFGFAGGRLPYTVVRNPERFIRGLDVPEPIKDVLERAVEWDTEKRFDTMAAFVEAMMSHAEVVRGLAARALERNRFVIASEHYTRLWSLCPGESVEIKRILGTIYLRMEAWEEAFECLSTALDEAGEPEVFFPLLREWAAGTDGWKRYADVLWNQARQRGPVQRASMRGELARITEEHLGDAQGASELWTLVLQDHRLPERGKEALEALSRLAEARGDWKNQVEYSRELLPYLAPDARPEVQHAIGRAYLLELQDEDAALHWIDKAEAAGVESLELTQKLQEVRARRGQWRRVIGLMRLEADNEKRVHNASRILLRAATIARAVHLDPEAEAIYENMLQRAPQHYPALRELARMRHRGGHEEAAMEAYARLVGIYDGKSEEPEASERASDHTAYAQLLLARDRDDEALVQLRAALILQPDNCEALKLAGPLYLDAGRLEEGAKSLESLYALFKAVRTHGERLDAAIQRADAAWFRGRLTVAMRWYNTVLDTVPEHPAAWWGLAKVAIAARGGHPGADRAPWLAHTPDRYTPQESLARLLMGLFDADGLSAFLSHHPLGKGVAGAGGTGARLACATVDLLVRYGGVDDAFFERLLGAFPVWEPRIRSVQRLWSEGDDGFDFTGTYRWARAAFSDDFSVKAHRLVSGPGEPIRGRLSVDFATDAHWEQLLSAERPEAPPLPEDEPSRVFEDTRSPMAVQFLLGDNMEFEFPAGAWEGSIGSAPECDWVLGGLGEQHATLLRCGHAIYLRSVADRDMSVDGESVSGWRLVGGETVQLGSYLWDVRLVEGRVETFPFGANLQEQPGDADPTWTGVRVDTESAAAEHETEGPDTPRELASDGSTELAAAVQEEEAEPHEDEVVEGGEAPDEDGGVAEADELPDEDVDVPEDASEPVIDEVSEVDESDAHADPVLEEDSATIVDAAQEEATVGVDRADFQAAVAGLQPEPTLRDPFEDGDSQGPPSGSHERTELDGAPPSGEPPADPPTLAPADLDFGDDEFVVEAGPDDFSEEIEGDFSEEIDPISEPLIDIGEDGWPLPAGDRAVSFGMLGDKDAPTTSGPADFGDLPEPDRDLPLDTNTGIPSDGPSLFGVSQIVERVPESGTHRSEPPEDAGAFTSIFASDPDEGSQDFDEVATQVDAYVPSPAATVPESSDWVSYEEEPAESSDGEGPKVTATLEIMSGASRGTHIPLHGVVALGRDESCEIYLPSDPYLSPLHCRFVQTDDSYLVMDNGTKRGTVVNSKRVSEAVLKGGDTIMVGHTVLRFLVQVDENG